ncbi:hypothetical protein D3C81_692830 [compost metagenome]
MQCFEYYALVVAKATVLVISGACRGATGVSGSTGHAAAALVPAFGETLCPHGRVAGVLAFVFALLLFRCRRTRRCGTAWCRHFRRGAGLGQAFVHRFVEFADAGGELALAQLEQHQPYFRGQFTGIERFMHGHADVLGADGIGVRVQRGHTTDPRQTVIQPRQHLLPVAQQDGGEIAHGQARFKNVLGHQAQATFALPGQYAVSRQRRAGFQRRPGLLQVGTKAAGDFLAAPTQFAHAVQEGQLRRTGGLGAVEQYVVKAGQHLAKGL